MRSWIEKQRNLIDFTLSALLRRKGKNIALIVAYIYIVFVLASVMFFTQAMKKEAFMVLEGAPAIVVQKMVAGRHDLIPVSYMEKIRQIRGVSDVRGRLWGYYFDPIIGANYTLMVREGFSLGPESIAVGSGISRSRLANEGDTMSFRSYDGDLLGLQIKEILSSDSELVSCDLILMSEDDFRRLFGIAGGYVTDITVQVKNIKEVPVVGGKINELLPDTRPILRDELLRTYDTVFEWRGGILFAILAGTFMAFIVFSWDKATGLSAEERREIGVLKAIGWETSDILQMKFWEGFSVSTVSFLLGTLFAYFHVFLTSATFFEPIIKGWSVLYPDFKLVPFIDIYHLIVLFFLIVFPYSVATIVPSWRASTIDPDSVLRL